LVIVAFVLRFFSFYRNFGLHFFQLIPQYGRCPYTDILQGLGI
jgi:hypothetical protein